MQSKSQAISKQKASVILEKSSILPIIEQENFWQSNLGVMILEVPPWKFSIKEKND